ncbi:MAG: septum formation initiator family protein [bacterium]
MRTIVSTCALVLAGGYLLFSFLGPGGIPMVLEKRRQIRELQEQNSELQRQLQESRERIRSFRENAGERDRRVREDQGKLKKDETTFLIPAQ